MCLANNDDLGYWTLNCIATSCYIHVFLCIWSCKQNKAVCVMNSYDSMLPSHYCSIFSADRLRNTPAAISCDVVAPSRVWNYKIYQELNQPLSTILTNPGFVMTWPAFAFDGEGNQSQTWREQTTPHRKACYDWGSNQWPSRCWASVLTSVPTKVTTDGGDQMLL